MMRSYVSAGMTHAGCVRERNEDAFVERTDIGLWAVADGAGGHGFGDIASAAVVAALTDLPTGFSAAELIAQVRLRLEACHAALQRRTRPDGSQQIMASTVVLLMARGDHFACLWAGDSRAYLLRADRLTRLTRDHTLVQKLVDSGVLDGDAAKHHPQSHVITRAVGAIGALDLDKSSARVASGDIFLLCSDGLYDVFAEAEIEARLAAGETAGDLISAAVSNGASDNVTALIVRAVGQDGVP